jgi:hypothetical protein
MFSSRKGEAKPGGKNLWTNAKSWEGQRKRKGNHRSENHGILVIASICETTKNHKTRKQDSDGWWLQKLGRIPMIEWNLPTSTKNLFESHFL